MKSVACDDNIVLQYDHENSFCHILYMYKVIHFKCILKRFQELINTKFYLDKNKRDYALFTSKELIS